MTATSMKEEKLTNPEVQVGDRVRFTSETGVYSVEMTVGEITDTAWVSERDERALRLRILKEDQGLEIEILEKAPTPWPTAAVIYIEKGTETYQPVTGYAIRKEDESYYIPGRINGIWKDYDGDEITKYRVVEQ